jgi:hypothetical protein
MVAVSFRHGRGAGRRRSQSSKINDMRDLSHREMRSVAISSRTMDVFVLQEVHRSPTVVADLRFWPKSDGWE